MYSIGCTFLVTELFFSAVFEGDQTTVYINKYNERNVEIIVVPIAAIISIVGNIIIIRQLIKDYDKAIREEITLKRDLDRLEKSLSL